MAYQLNVPFNAKDEAKSLGAKWNAAAKSWFWVSGDFPDALVQFSPLYHKAVNRAFVPLYVNAFIAKQKEVGFDALGPRYTEEIKTAITAAGVKMFNSK